MVEPVPRILITGARGFVGRHLMAEFQSTGREELKLFAADRLQILGATNDVEHVVLDVVSPEAVDEIIRDVHPDVVVHLAAVAESSLARSAPRSAWEVNLFGTMNLADALLRRAPQSTFIFAGSCDSFGQTFELVDGPVGEDEPLRPTTCYGATKAAADLLVGQMSKEGLRAVRFRPFNHTGPAQSPRYVVPALARQIARIENHMQSPLIEVGNLEVERDFLDVRDVVRAYAEAVSRRATLEPGIIINLASGKPRRIRSILDRLIALSQIPMEIRITNPRVGETLRTWGSFERARRLLDWSPSIPFDRTLSDVLNYWRDHISGTEDVLLAESS